jgi:hypothetical protein
LAIAVQRLGLGESRHLPQLTQAGFGLSKRFNCGQWSPWYVLLMWLPYSNQPH